MRKASSAAHDLDLTVPASARTALMQLTGIRKVYVGVVALDCVDLTVEAGSIHAVLGENGAGKSTLIKIMTGVVAPTAGTLAIDGRKRSFQNPGQAVAERIACVYQELSLIPDLSVADNIFLSHGSARLGFFNGRKQIAEAERVLGDLGCDDIDPRALVLSLPLPQAQIVEIAKALVHDPRLLILDEATSALGDRQVHTLFALLRKLRGQGKSIVYISHRMHEIEAIADSCTVFRNGRNVATFQSGSQTQDAIISMMIGRDIDHAYPPKTSIPEGDPVLKVENLTWEDRLTGVSFSVRRGEIYGISGLGGQGQRETLWALFGVLRRVGGEISVAGGVKPSSPRAALRGRPGVALVPEDRKREGLHLGRSIVDNMTLAVPQLVSSFGVFMPKRRDALARSLAARLQIKMASSQVEVGTFSGGNQQKVVIAKFLASEPSLILLSDPTRGIDVGTKAEIYLLLRELAQAGATIVLHSTDVQELIGLCDRIGVFYRGRIARELSGPEITEEAILSESFGLTGSKQGEIPWRASSKSIRRKFPSAKAMPSSSPAMPAKSSSSGPSR